jgi:glucose/arabinose dehydrogenase
MTRTMANRFLQVALLLCAFTASDGAGNHAAAYRAVPIGTFNRPIDTRVAPGQGNSLYIAEQPGKIFVLVNEQRRATPFLNIEALALFGGEQGLLSFVFAPDYATTRRFYVLYVNNSGNVEIDEFLRSPTAVYQAMPGSRRKVIEIPHPDAGNHNGGQLHFGSDGYLYASIGDGGSTADPGDPARRLNSLLGKILRIDPRATATRAYRIPPDNPFVGRTGRNEIFAYGLRNPYRFSLTPNFIAIGDVGQARAEEVNLLPIADARGANFGWPEFEGNLSYDPTKPGPGPAVFPMFTYSHSNGRCAIIGGHIVRDTGLPALQGRYLYGDFCTGRLRSFVPDVAGQRALNDSALGVTILRLSSIGKGWGGQVYLTDSTRLYRLEP